MPSMAPLYVRSAIAFLYLCCSVSLFAACSDPETSENVDVGCRLNSDCPVGQQCVDAACVEDDTQCIGPDCPCASNADCGLGEGCDVETGQCFALECLGDRDCALGEVCVQGQCQTDVEADRDRDGVPDNEDNCPDTPNADQEDAEGDGQGDGCDDDDDNDGAPDTVDNCPGVHNPEQADANNDDSGNACDDAVRGTTVVGQLNFESGGDADTTLARVFLSGLNQPINIEPDGRFAFEQALPRGGPFSIRVQWPGFLPLERAFVAPLDQETFDVEVLELVAEAQDEETAAVLGGLAQLQGQNEHTDIVVRAFVGDALVATTLTDDTGRYVMQASRVDHRLRFSKENFIDRELEVSWDEGNQRFVVDEAPLETFEGVVLQADRSASVVGALSSPLENIQWPVVAQVTLIGGGESRALPVLPDGTFSAELLQPGLYGLATDVRGHLATSQVVELGSGVTELETIALVPQFEAPEEAVTMRGRMLRGDVAPDGDHAGIVVRARIGDDLVATTLTDTDGTFVLTASPVTYQLDFALEGYAPRDITVLWDEVDERFEFNAVALDAVDDLTLTPNPTATLTGRLDSPLDIEDWGGRAFVTLQGDDFERIETVLSNGGFQFAGVRPGTYALIVSARGHQPASQQVELVGGDNTLEDIVLVPEQVTLVGQALLQGEEVHEGIVVRARLGEVLVGTTVTGQAGDFAFQLTPERHTLTLSSANFITQTVTVEWDGDGFVLGGQPVQDRPVELVREPLSDRDGDGFIDILDNCPQTFNPNQDNLDGDDLGDRCDLDMDDDGLSNNQDNCPRAFNPMQEDLDGLGLGLACSGNDLASPLPVGCGIRNQRLNTQGRASAYQGACGGTGAPEVAYEILVRGDERIRVDVEAEFATTIALVRSDGQELDCVLGKTLEVFGPDHPDQDGNGHAPDRYLLVVDGFNGASDAGPISVTIQNTACIWNNTQGLTSHSLASGQLSDALVADINLDGHMDVVAKQTEDEVYIRYGRGDGTFAATQTIELNLDGREMSAADINDDGLPDLIFSNGFDNDGFTHMLQDPDQPTGFAPQQVIHRNPAHSILDMVVADVTADGIKDIVAAELDDVVLVFEGQGNGIFAEPFELEAVEQPRAVTLGDFNSDGLPDIAALAGVSEEVLIYLGQDGGGFEPLGRSRVGDNPQDIATADFNNDAILDLAITNENGDTLSILMGLGDGRFEPQRLVETLNAPVHIATGDANNNGIQDIVLSGNNDDHVQVLQGDGRGDFEPQQPVETPWRSDRVALADFNNDGTMDITLIGNTNDDSGFVTLLGEIDNTFTPPTTLSMGRSPEDAITADLNNDGLLDIISADNGSDTVTVRLALPNGHFGAPRSTPTTERPNSLASADLNGDGHVDVVVSTLVDDNVDVLLNQGNGTLSLVSSHAMGAGASDIKLVDYNGDGHIDAMCAELFGDDIALRLGTGNGGFGSRVLIDFDSDVEAFDVADINNDGHMDIVASIGSDNIFSFRSDVLLLYGRDALQPAAPIRITNQFNNVRALKFADMNNDGRQDIVALSASTAVVMLRQINGSYSPPISTQVQPGLSIISSISNADSLALRDFNQDGVLDIWTANNNNDLVALAIGNGNGSFQNFRSLKVGDQPASVHLADINNDGALDVVTANRDAASVSILIQSQTSLQGPGASSTSTPNDPCPALIVSGTAADDALAFDVDHPEVCKVTRLDLEVLNPGEQRSGALTLQSKHNNTALLSPTQALPTGLFWRPEQLGALARFENTPAQGRWLLSGLDAQAQVVLHINNPPWRSLWARRSGAGVRGGRGSGRRPPLGLRARRGAGWGRTLRQPGCGPPCARWPPQRGFRGRSNH